MEGSDGQLDYYAKLARLRFLLTAASGSTLAEDAPDRVSEIRAKVNQALSLATELKDSRHVQECLETANAKKEEAARKAASGTANTSRSLRVVAGYVVGFAVSIGGFFGIALYEPGFMVATMVLLGIVAAVIVQVISHPDRDWSDMDWVGDIIPSAAVTFFGVLFVTILILLLT
jgi:hypothetical protein